MNQRASTVWLTFAEVCQHVRKSENIVRARMVDTQREGCPVEKCWTNDGTEARPVYSFRSIEDVDRWWWEINEWRASVTSSAAKSPGKSDGESQDSTKKASPRSSSGATRSARATSQRSTSDESANAKSSAQPSSPNTNAIPFLRSERA